MNDTKLITSYSYLSSASSCIPPGKIVNSLFTYFLAVVTNKVNGNYQAIFSLQCVGIISRIFNSFVHNLSNPNKPVVDS